MNFCLPKNVVDNFIAKVKSGEVNPEKLSEMTSEERHAFLATIVGEQNALRVNASFESKLLLKNQQKGLVNWAKDIAQKKPKVYRDLLSRIQKMDRILKPDELEAFMSDLAEQRLGFGVTVEEAGKISAMSKEIADKKAAIPESDPIGSDKRMEYGLALANFKDYVSELKLQAKKVTPWEITKDIFGAAKSIKASFDNSFFGRQGLKVLFTHPEVWVKDFAKSWSDIGKELRGIDAMKAIKADVFSRPNAINGKYAAIGVDIGIAHEEAFPSALPEKIPVLKRLYKASESAYNGAALRMRADVADLEIKLAEAANVDVFDKDLGLGTIINTMTGRGKTTLLSAEGAEAANIMLYSAKFASSQFNFLTANWLDPKVSKYAKLRATQNLWKVLTGIGTILTMAKMLDEDSVEWDPRSAKFGYIMFGPDHQYAMDVTGGLRNMIVLFARIFPTIHNGKLGWWMKSQNGKYKRMGTGKFGETTIPDLIQNFAAGKLSPLPRILYEWWVGRGYDGKKFSIKKALASLGIPMVVENVEELKGLAEDDKVLFSLAEGFDFLGLPVRKFSKTKKKR